MERSPQDAAISGSAAVLNFLREQKQAIRQLARLGWINGYSGKWLAIDVEDDRVLGQNNCDGISSFRVRGTEY